MHQPDLAAIRAAEITRSSTGAARITLRKPRGVLRDPLQPAVMIVHGSDSEFGFYIGTQSVTIAGTQRMSRIT